MPFLNTNIKKFALQLSKMKSSASYLKHASQCSSIHIPPYPLPLSLYPLQSSFCKNLCTAHLASQSSNPLEHDFYNMVRERVGFGVIQARYQLNHPIHYMALGKLVRFSGPQFPHLKSRDKSTYFIGGEN